MVLVTLFVIPAKSTASFCGCRLGRCQLQNQHAPSTREATATAAMYFLSDVILPDGQAEPTRSPAQTKTWPHHRVRTHALSEAPLERRKRTDTADNGIPSDSPKQPIKDVQDEQWLSRRTLKCDG